MKTAQNYGTTIPHLLPIVCWYVVWYHTYSEIKHMDRPLMYFLAHRLYG